MIVLEKSWIGDYYFFMGRLEFDSADDPDFGYVKEQIVAIVLGWADPIEID